MNSTKKVETFRKDGQKVWMKLIKRPISLNEGVICIDKLKDISNQNLMWTNKMALKIDSIYNQKKRDNEVN